MLNFAGYWFDLFRSLVTPTQEKSLFQARKQLAHNFSRTESSPAGPQKVQVFMLGTDHCSNRQCNSCLVHKQRRGYEIRLSLCPPLETASLVQPQANSAEGQAHPRSSAHDSAQAVQTHAGNSDQVVSFSGGVRPLVLPMNVLSLHWEELDCFML